MSLVDPVFVAQGPFRRMQELSRTLRAAGIGAEIVQPPGADANA